MMSSPTYHSQSKNKKSQLLPLKNISHTLPPKQERAGSREAASWRKGGRRNPFVSPRAGIGRLCCSLVKSKNRIQEPGAVYGDTPGGRVLLYLPGSA